MSLNRRKIKKEQIKIFDNDSLINGKSIYHNVDLESKEGTLFNQTAYFAQSKDK